MRKISGYKLIIIAGVIPFVFSACGKKEAEKTEPVKKVEQPKEAPQPKPAVAEQKEDDKDLQARQRNPFQSHIIVTKALDGEKKAKGPLECCEANSFRLVAVAVSEDSSFALLQAPDTKRYIVRRGDVIGLNDGRIVNINHKGILIKEYTKDEAGKVIATTDIELGLPVEKAK